jgi:HK97 gp10 family phage protein
MASIKFIDHREKVKGLMADLAMAALEEAAGELEAQVKRNTAVDTGQTKNSWQHRVTEGRNEYVAQVGSDYENAIWEEFGTGDYALKGNGRKGGWFYEDEEGNGYFTHGKKPSRAFWNAYTALKSKIINHIQNSLKGL